MPRFESIHKKECSKEDVRAMALERSTSCDRLNKLPPYRMEVLDVGDSNSVAAKISECVRSKRKSSSNKDEAFDLVSVSHHVSYDRERLLTYSAVVKLWHSEHVYIPSPNGTYKNISQALGCILFLINDLMAYNIV